MLLKKIYKNIFVVPAVFLMSCFSGNIIPMVTPGYPVSDIRFIKTVAGISGNPLESGNSIDVFDSGIETFQNLFSHIESAEKSINVEMYLYDEDETGRKFAELLSRKAREGVRVNVILDSVGAKDIGRKIPAMMRKSGVRLYFFNPLIYYSYASMINRTHKKIIVIDGKYGITGGFGISDQWNDDGSNPEKIRDLQIIVEGPVVRQMQNVFAENWEVVSGEVLEGDGYFPANVNRKGKFKSRFIQSIPRNGKAVIHQLFIFSIKSARRSLYIETPYFIPDKYTLNGIIHASKRGVDVKLLLPSPETSDLPPSAHVARTYYEELLKSGVRIYEYKKQKIHSKFMIVDNELVSLGSANIDRLSLEKNQEANLNIYGSEFADRMNWIFQKDISDSEEIRLTDFQKRSYLNRIKESYYSIYKSHF